MNGAKDITELTSACPQPLRSSLFCTLAFMYVGLLLDPKKDGRRVKTRLVGRAFGGSEGREGYFAGVKVGISVVSTIESYRRCTVLWSVVSVLLAGVI
jgi:hypothetical protein